MAKSVILQMAEQALSDRSMVAFHSSDQEPGRFFCGYVSRIEDGEFLVEYVDAIDEDSGFFEDSAPSAWFDFEEIVWMKVDTPYLIGLASLAHEKDGLDTKERGLILRSPDQMAETASRAKDAGVILTILNSGDEEAVLPVEVEETRMLASLINEEDGSLAGSGAYEFIYTQAMRVDSVQERKLTLLHRLRYGRKA